MQILKVFSYPKIMGGKNYMSLAFSFDDKLDCFDDKFSRPF